MKKKKQKVQTEQEKIGKKKRQNIVKKRQKEKVDYEEKVLEGKERM